MSTRKHLSLQPGFEMPFKTGARKAVCNVFIAARLDKARC